MSRDDDTAGTNPDDHPENLPENSPNNGDGYERGGGTDRGSASYGYQPTHHPEDAPGGFNPGNNAMGNQNGSGFSSSNSHSYDTPYSGYEAYDGNNANAYGTDSNQGGAPLETATGRVDVMRAVRFGFKTVFSNPAIWILGTVVLGFLFILLSMLLGMLVFFVDQDGMMGNDPLSPGNLILNIVITVATFAVTICVMRGALIQTDGRKARLGDFFRPINVGQTVILLIVFTVIGLVVGTITSIGTTETMTVDEGLGTVEVNNSLLTIVLLAAIVMALINPLYAYWVYYTSDGRENAVGAASHGFKDAMRNYLPLLAYSIVSGIVVLVLSLVTLLLALVILLPASMLINAHLYRQMSGGQVPVEVR